MTQRSHSQQPSASQAGKTRRERPVGRWRAAGIRIAWLAAAGLISACAVSASQDGATETPPAAGTGPASSGAKVLSVGVSGDDGAFTFAVQIASPDTGCDRYADWWEVLTPDGQLIYRRILLHSHVDEQPFTRSGGTVAIAADTPVVVRAHMHPDGYASSAMQGTVSDGFTSIDLPAGFAGTLESLPPQPEDCAF